MKHPDCFYSEHRAARTTAIVGGVIAAHAAGLWALHAGLLARPHDTLEAPQVLSAYLAPAAPEAPPPKALPTPPVAAPTKPATPRTEPKAPARPAPMPQAITDNTPAPNPPAGSLAETPPAAPTAMATTSPVPLAAAHSPPAPPAPPRMETPSSDAAYLNNPKPAYPAASKRMGEQGKVVLRVLIGADGLPQKIELSQSSGFDRLDRAAQDAVGRWKFVPGKRNGVPEAMWNLVPINFVLE